MFYWKEYEKKIISNFENIFPITHVRTCGGSNGVISCWSTGTASGSTK